MAEEDRKRARKAVSHPDFVVGENYKRAMDAGGRCESEKYKFFCFQNARINGTGQEFEVRWKTGEITWENEEHMKKGCLLFTNVSQIFHVYSFLWLSGAREVVEKAKALCIKYIIRYQNRPVPAPENALVLPSFIFQKKEEIALQMCRALKCAASPGNPSKPGSTRSTDNTVKIETIVMNVDLLLGLLPELFQENLMDRITLLQHDRWSCDASPARFFPWVLSKCGLEFATRTGRRVTVAHQQGKVSGLVFRCCPYLVIHPVTSHLTVCSLCSIRSAFRVCSWTHTTTLNALAAHTSPKGASVRLVIVKCLLMLCFYSRLASGLRTCREAPW